MQEGYQQQPGESRQLPIENTQQVKADQNEVVAEDEIAEATEEEQPHRTIQNQFSEKEIQNLHQIFKLFDKNLNGYIDSSDLKNIMSSINRGPEQVDEIINSMDPNQDGKLMFQEFITLMGQLEKKIQSSDGVRKVNKDGSIVYKGGDDDYEDEEGKQPFAGGMFLDSKVLDFLRLLEEYRKKCENEGNYTQAKKSKLKYSELLKKETMRQKNNLKASQQMELMNIQTAQKKQFIQFSEAWDTYMQDYEATAYLSLQKLKEKHLKDFESFQQKTRKDMVKRFKYSRQVLELRKKESVLVKLKQYDDAEKMKQKAEILEKFEDQKLQNEIQAAIQKKQITFKKNQQNALQALLNRIQRDRNEQLKHRQQDSMRLIQRNKNLLNDLINKQNSQAKRILEGIKSNMELTKVDKMFVPMKKNSFILPPKKGIMGSTLRANSANPRPRNMKGQMVPPPKLNTSFKQVL